MSILDQRLGFVQAQQQAFSQGAQIATNAIRLAQEAKEATSARMAREAQVNLTARQVMLAEETQPLRLKLMRVQYEAASKQLEDTLALAPAQAKLAQKTMANQLAAAEDDETVRKHYGEWLAAFREDEAEAEKHPLFIPTWSRTKALESQFPALGRDDSILKARQQADYRFRYMQQNVLTDETINAQTYLRLKEQATALADTNPEAATRLNEMAEMLKQTTAARSLTAAGTTARERDWTTYLRVMEEVEADTSLTPEQKQKLTDAAFRKFIAASGVDDPMLELDLDMIKAEFRAMVSEAWGKEEKIAKARETATKRATDAIKRAEQRRGSDTAVKDEETLRLQAIEAYDSAAYNWQRNAIKAKYRELTGEELQP